MVCRNESILIPDSNQRPMLRAGDQLDLGFEHRHASALGPHQRASHIESLGQQVVEVVARDTARNLRKPGPYLIGILFADRAQRGVNLGRPPALAKDAIKIVTGRRANSHLRSVVQQNPQLFDIVDRFAA